MEVIRFKSMGQFRFREKIKSFNPLKIIHEILSIAIITRNKSP